MNRSRELVGDVLDHHGRPGLEAGSKSIEVDAIGLGDLVVLEQMHDSLGRGGDGGRVRA